MSEVGRFSFKQSNVRGFLFFLLLTSVMAILIKLSKTYTKVYRLPIHVQNVPIDKVVNTIDPGAIELTTTLTGFALMANSFSDMQMNIDFNDLNTLEDARYLYTPSSFPIATTSIIPNAIEITAIRPEAIHINMDVLSSKEVVVRPKLKVEYSSGYGPSGNMVLTPQKVTLVGAKHTLDTIDMVYTEPKSLEGVHEKITTQLTIDTMGYGDAMAVSSRQISYEQDVAKYTEGSFVVPVTIKNNKGVTLKIFPQTVDVYFTANLSEYRSVLATDFEVICDFNTRNATDEYIPLTITRSPESVKNVRLATKQIKYIIVN